MKRTLLLLLALIPVCSFSQNVGIGTTIPLSTLHLRATADTTQLLIDGGTAQGNRPLLRFRKANGDELVQLRSDNEANIFLGYNAGQKNVLNGLTGSGNTAFGGHALQFNVNGYFNTAIGSQSLQSNTGADNTAVGAGAMLFNSSGFSNTAVGSKAMVWNNIGAWNTALGTEALYNNIAGQENTAVGYKALYSNTSNYNTAVGFRALTDLTTGTRNTAIGDGALYEGIIVSENTAIGYYSLAANTSGGANTAIGAYALRSNKVQGNTAIGHQALLYNNFGIENTAVGRNSLKESSEGMGNSAIGSGALINNTTGNWNVAVGFNALYYNQTGSNNTALGYNAGTSMNGQYINTISIGNHNYHNAAYNQAFLGNLNIAWNGGNVGWSTFSDTRIKNNIQEDVKGLDFIMRLRPVTYFRSTKAALELTGNVDSLEYEGKYDIEKIKFSGFLAQEVEAAAKAIGYDFQGVQAPKTSQQMYSLSYETFVVPLVKAVQEQQAQVETLKKENTTLKQEQDLMRVRLEKLEKAMLNKQ